MIGISTLTQNAEGHLVIHEKKSSALDEHPARVSRTKTLDGGVHINHFGVSDGDRTLSIVARLSDADWSKLVTIHKTETFIHVSCQDGFYEAVISDVRRKNADTVINILIKQKEF